VETGATIVRAAFGRPAVTYKAFRADDIRPYRNDKKVLFPLPSQPFHEIIYRR